MTRTLPIIVAVLILLASISFGYYLHDRSGSTQTAPPLTLNQKVSSMVSGFQKTYTQEAKYNNVSTNITSIFNNVMNSFYSLENLSSFKGYYANYSVAFSYGSV